jgi:DNA (cytosine-5)-methyltransferase 1
MQSIELFAGGGGLALGIERAGFEHVAVVEHDCRACATLTLNARWPIISDDVRALNYAAYTGIDLLSGGPPCQPFSQGGRHLAAHDLRDMFPAIIQAVHEAQPRAFLIENVAGITRQKFAAYFGQILDTLSAAGYVVSYTLVNAADYGVPQVRRRAFVVGFREDLDLLWAPPTPTHSQQSWLTVADTLADLPDPEWFPGATLFADHRFQPNARAYAGHTGSPLDKPAKTLKAGVHGVPGGENMLKRADGSLRYFSVREAARLQTFPDNWRFAGEWTEALHQIGNAVPVKLAEIMAQSVAVQLRYADV